MFFAQYLISIFIRESNYNRYYCTSTVYVVYEYVMYSYCTYKFTKFTVVYSHILVQNLVQVFTVLVRTMYSVHVYGYIRNESQNI